MARAYTKCSNCNDIMWFGDNETPPQAVRCPCNQTELTEEGAVGSSTSLTQEEIDNLP